MVYTYYYYGYTKVYYSIHTIRTAYLDDGLWVWQYQSEHSGGSSKQHHNMSTPDLLYTDVWQHRPRTSQDQLESIVREVCVQGDLQQSQHISLIMPVYEFKNSTQQEGIYPKSSLGFATYTCENSHANILAYCATCV